MKKNNDKYWRIGIFAFVFVFGLFASVKTGNGWIALITCVVVPLLYIPYGISDWRRNNSSEPLGRLTSGKDDTESRQNNKCAQTIVGDKPVPACSTEIWLMRGYTLEKYYLNDECSEVEIHFLEECVNFNPGGEGVDKLFRFDKTVNMFYSVYYHWDAGNPRNEHYYFREFLDPVYFRAVLQNFRADKLRSDPYDEENMHEVYRIFDHISEMLMSWLSPAEPYRMFFEKQSDDTFSVTDTDALSKYAEP